MKTTSKSALAKRIAKLNISKNSLVYGWITTLETNQVLRPIFTQGSSWKHSSLVDKEFDKLSADNDMINNNLELIQNQNAILINLLTDLNNNIKKLQKNNPAQAYNI